jgi:hypothetical protein
VSKIIMRGRSIDLILLGYLSRIRIDMVKEKFIMFTV